VNIADNMQWDAFAQSQTYDKMSTVSTPDANAFELPHGNVHYFVGGGGHMFPVSFSAFDPALYVFLLFFH